MHYHMVLKKGGIYNEEEFCAVYIKSARIVFPNLRTFSLSFSLSLYIYIDDIN